MFLKRDFSNKTLKEIRGQVHGKEHRKLTQPEEEDLSFSLQKSFTYDWAQFNYVFLSNLKSHGVKINEGDMMLLLLNSLHEIYGHFII